MSTNVEEPWAPEPELHDSPPRPLRPSVYPDYNVPNVLLYRGVGAVALLAGIVLLVMGASKGPAFLGLGVLLIAGGVFALILPGMHARRVKERAERLVREGQPLMARIVTSINLTGDSVHGRTVTYMMTVPGGDTVRRDVNVDERALPKRIPANVTVLIHPQHQHDFELYCALPFRAVPRPQPVILPDAAPAESTMGAVPEVKPEEPDEPAPQKQPSSPGYQGLPWE